MFDLKKLRFLPHLIPKILNGKKTATTRIGKRKIKIGDKLECLDSDGNCYGILTIKNVEYINFNEITDEMARKEDLSTKEDLQKSLFEIYGDRVYKEPLTFIEFELDKSG